MVLKGTFFQDDTSYFDKFKNVNMMFISSSMNNDIKTVTVTPTL